MTRLIRTRDNKAAREARTNRIHAHKATALDSKGDKGLPKEETVRVETATKMAILEAQPKEEETIRREPATKIYNFSRM